jgi:hypothetical protein
MSGEFLSYFYHLPLQEKKRAILGGFPKLYLIAQDRNSCK